MIKHVKLAIALQRAVKYNKCVRKSARKDNLHQMAYKRDLETAEGALEKALNDVADIGYIGVIWKDNLIDQIIVGGQILEVV